MPNNATVSLRASTSAGDLHSHNGATCQRSGNAFVCTVTASRTSLRFGVRNQSRPTLTFTVTPANGYTDPTPGNNSVSVAVPRR